MGSRPSQGLPSAMGGRRSQAESTERVARKRSKYADGPGAGVLSGMREGHALNGGGREKVLWS